MALIQCGNCGKEVSDKAAICPNCGARLLEEAASDAAQEKQPCTCEECGAEIPAEAEACPSCGHPAPDCEAAEKASSKKRIVIGVILLVIVIIAAAVGVTAYKTHSVRNYEVDLYTAAEMMVDGALTAEKVGNLTIAVWHNSIFEERDAETDQYTCPNGYFYDDFNDALEELFSDSSVQNEISSIVENQTSVAERMKALGNPPKGYEEAYGAIREFYDAYLEFTNLAINPTGSLQTYSSNFNDADTKALNACTGMQIYLG